MSFPVKHPDSIPGLAPDCRRVLRGEYAVIVARAGSPKTRKKEVSSVSACGRYTEWQEVDVPQEKTVAQAIAEYRRVAEMWGVEV